MLIVALAPAIASAQVRQPLSADDPNRLWDEERPNLERLARLTQEQGGTVLFLLDGSLGLAKARTVSRLQLPDTNVHCPYRASLSHDGHFLAFLSSQKSGGCDISIYTVRPGTIRHLVNLPYAPSSLLWSWDDAEIAFTDSRGFSPAAIQAVSVRDGSVRTIVESSRLATQQTHTGIRLRFDGSAPMQWSHAGDELLVGFSREVPTSQPNTYLSYRVEYRIGLANDGRRSEFADGYDAAVSPVADRVAWYRGSNILLANFDGTNQQVLARAPRWMRILPGDFKGPLVWSPNGKQLFFGVLDSETCRDNVYLLHVETRRSSRFIHRTCIMIEDWR